MRQTKDKGRSSTAALNTGDTRCLSVPLACPLPILEMGKSEAQRQQQFRNLQLRFQQTHTLLLEPLSLEQPLTGWSGRNGC